MNLLRCGNGHYYDGDIYPRCPYCANSNVPVRAAKQPENSALEQYRGEYGYWREDYDHCHRCRGLLQKDDRWCRHCGIRRKHIPVPWFEIDLSMGQISIDRPYIPEGEQIICKGCGFERDPGETYCPRCGSADFQYKTKPPENLSWEFVL